MAQLVDAACCVLQPRRKRVKGLVHLCMCVVCQSGGKVNTVKTAEQNSLSRRTSFFVCFFKNI